MLKKKLEEAIKDSLRRLKYYNWIVQLSPQFCSAGAMVKVFMNERLNSV